MPAARTWLTATPLDYGGNLLFWNRDAGLLCLGLAELGVPARLVLLGDPSERHKEPITLGRLEDFTNPAWWRGLDAAGVILNSWGAPRYEPVARAIRTAGLRLVVRLDSSGDKSPRLSARGFFTFNRSLLIDEGRPLPRLQALAKTVLFHAVRAAHDGPMCAHLSHADLITIESPRACLRFRELLGRLGRADLGERLRVLPHPVLDAFQTNANLAKQPLLLAAGRWQSHFKDTPKLVRVFGQVLAREPTARVRILGSGDELVRHEIQKLPAAVQARFDVHGPVPHLDLVPHLQAAQVVFCSSRLESFHLVSAEGLCCGCSVVGPAEIPSMHWFTGEQSGTLAADRSDARLADALVAELAAWRSGARDPQRLSAMWRARLTARSVAAEALRLLAENEPARVTP